MSGKAFSGNENPGRTERGTEIQINLYVYVIISPIIIIKFSREEICRT
jgi:hypothetical protein